MKSDTELFCRRVLNEILLIDIIAIPKILRILQEIAEKNHLSALKRANNRLTEAWSHQATACKTAADLLELTLPK